MTLTTLPYGLFLGVICLGYWLLPQETWRLRLLLGSSFLFYGLVFSGALGLKALDGSAIFQCFAYLPFLLASTLLNFWIGLMLGQNSPLSHHNQDLHLSEAEWEYAQADWGKKRWYLLWMGITLNVLLLLGFKYVPFLVETVSLIFHWEAGPVIAQEIRRNLIAPLGLSFFSFESIAYLIDVYRGAPATGNFLRFCTYKFFFPKFMSGPICGYHAISKQLRKLEFPRINQWAEGFWLLGLGACKKVLLADRLGTFVDLSYGSLERAGSGDIWLTVVVYGLQLYLDFSGYVDMARGSALLLGIVLPENFDAPYFTTSIADFWRRWHMTLGSWLRNYLYFPLGGSRQGLIRTCGNLLIVMIIAGIWHGANWGFIVWGALHGLALVVHRLTATLGKRITLLQAWWQSVPGTVLAWGLTQGFVFGSWIFFRLPNLKQAQLALMHFWHWNGDIQFAQKVYMEQLGLERPQFSLLIGLLIAIMALLYGLRRITQLQLNWPLKLILAPLLLYSVLQLAPNGTFSYIYFDF
jgi:alginate O-acetyltransferase complex protein AlgI